MKRVFAFIVFLAIPAMAFAQPGSPVINFPSSVYNFGNLKQHDRSTHEFKFYNKGHDTLRLSDPKSSCGCTAVLLSQYNIAPGDSGVIKVSLTAVPGVTGPVEKHVYVNSADNPPQKLETLTIKANVVGEIAIDNNYIHYKSEVGETEKVKIHVTSTTDEPIELDNVSVALMEYADTSASKQYNSANVRASPVTEFTVDVGKKKLDPGEETDLIVGIPSRERGQINGSVRIALPNSIITIGISGVIFRPGER